MNMAGQRLGMTPDDVLRAGLEGSAAADPDLMAEAQRGLDSNYERGLISHEQFEQQYEALAAAAHGAHRSKRDWAV